MTHVFKKKLSGRVSLASFPLRYRAVRRSAAAPSYSTKFKVQEPCACALMNHDLLNFSCAAVIFNVDSSLTAQSLQGFQKENCDMEKLSSCDLCSELSTYGIDETTVEVIRGIY